MLRSWRDERGAEDRDQPAYVILGVQVVSLVQQTRQDGLVVRCRRLLDFMVQEAGDEVVGHLVRLEQTCKNRINKSDGLIRFRRGRLSTAAVDDREKLLHTRLASDSSLFLLQTKRTERRGPRGLVQKQRPLQTHTGVSETTVTQTMSEREPAVQCRLEKTATA